MMMDLFDKLWPITRSITGNGVRETLNIINEIVPVKQLEFPTGKKCFDWEIPKEWNIKDAWIKNMNGEKIIDFKKNNLHILNYSVPFKGVLKREELLKHLYSLPDMPGAIPYRTSYYKENWGFCLEDKRLKELNDEEYEVFIDSELKQGYLTIGEGYIKGKCDEEILLSTYVCHPSMANNELSGPLVQTAIYKYLLENKKKLKYSYRFLYVPETIGPIVYLNEFGEKLKEKICAGFVITCVGDEGEFTYKKSRRGNSLVDRAVENVLRNSGKKYKVLDFFPWGSDERQYCSPYFNLPVGSLMKSMYGAYKEYHTSLDNKDFISEKGLKESIEMYLDIIETIEANETYISKITKCEPKLDKYGLYPTTNNAKERKESIDNILYIWSFSDGKTDLIEIANKLNKKGKDLKKEAKLLEEKMIIKNID